MTSKLQKRVCAWCGRTFTPKRNDAAKYHSNACRQAAFYDKRRQAAQA